MARKKTRSQGTPLSALRHQAEELLRAKVKDTPTLPTADVQALVHELNVHQMELEIQNDELREAQMELAESHDRYADLYDFAPVGYVTLGDEGVILEANLTAAKLFGIVRSELVGSKLSKFIERDSQDLFHLHRQEVFATGAKQQCEVPVLPVGGHPLTVRLESLAFHDERGNQSQCRTALIDLTDINQARQQLQESEQFTQRVLNNLFAFVGVMQLDGTLIEANEAPLQAAGISREDVYGKKFWDCYWWSYSPDVQRQLRDAYERAKQGEVVRYDVPVRMAGDERMIIDFQLAPMRNSAGEITHLIPSAMDITKRKQAENTVHKLNEELEDRVARRTAELITANDELSASRERLKYLLDNVDVIISDWEMPSMRPTFVSQRAEDILGYPIDEWFSTPRFWETTLLHPDDCDETVEFCARETEAGRNHDFVYRARHADGRTVWLHEFVKVIASDCGATSNLICVMVDITERKQAEQTLRESEERYRLFVNQTLDGTYRLDFDPPIPVKQPEDAIVQQMYERGVIGDCNNAYAHMYGYESSADMIGARLDDLHRGADVPENVEAMREFVRTGFQHLNVETAEVGKGGKLVYLLNNSIGIIEDEHYHCCWGTQTDITDLKLAEQAIGEREKRLRAILNTASDSVINVDRKGTITEANPATEQMFGYTQDELVGENVKILMPPPFCDEHDGHLARYLETGHANIIGIGREVVAKRKDGSTFPVEVTISEVEGLGLFTGIIRDITERKAAEESLRREHEFAESLTETAHHIVLVLDPNGRIIRLNPYTEELTGWKLDEVQGRDWFDTFIPEHDRVRIRNVFLQAIDGKWTRGNVNAILTKDGRERDVEWCDAPLTSNDGKLIGLLCTGLDVTERRMLEREVLEIAVEEQRRIGHELHDSTQQQLTGLGLLGQSVAESLEKLSLGDQKPKAQRQLAELCRRAKQVQQGLKQAAKEVNHLARGLIPVEVDARGLMSALTELALRISESRQIECSFICDTAIEVRNNFVATNLYRIAQEAVGNILKHSGADNIRVSLAELDEALRLKIVDNGVGIDENSTNGPGMGLRIMAYRADLIGATLRVGQADDGGAEVVCTIPYPRRN